MASDKGAAAPEDEECVHCLTKGSTKKGQGSAMYATLTLIGRLIGRGISSTA
jgi:hypothetical protein